MTAFPLPPAVVAWQARGRFITLSDLDVFVLEGGPRDAAQTLVLLHGFPSSSYDWHLIEPALSAGQRVVMFDFPGYGLSAKPTNYSYSLMEQADIVEQLVRALGITHAHVIAHDMGTSVACELMARRERNLLTFTVDSLVLMNGSMLLELAHLTPSQRLLRSRIGNLFARLSSRAVFRAQLRRIFVRPPGDEELDAMWAQLVHHQGVLRLPAIISYLDERVRFRERWIGALSRLDLPVLVLWAERDPIAVLAIGEEIARRIPHARLERLEMLGHYPQIEDPTRVAQALLEHLR